MRRTMSVLAVAAMITAASCSSGSTPSAAPGASAGTSRPSRTTVALQAPKSAAELGIVVPGPGCTGSISTRCALPFPNDTFTTPDGAAKTGRRLRLDPAMLPVSSSGKPLDVAPWNRLDGFSPGSALLAGLPGADLTASATAGLDTLERSMQPDAPVVIFDAASGKRHPYWVELDATTAKAGEPVLVVRPAVNFLEGHRYVVGIRHITRADGATVEPTPLFRSYRDGAVTTDATLEQARPAYEEVFGVLADQGVARGDLQLAWGFTVGSADSIAGPMLAMRDDAFARLGDAVPAFSVDKVTEHPEPKVLRQVDGTFNVPSYLSGDGKPGSHLVLGPDGRPARQGELTLPFRCIVPASAVEGTTTRPARMSLYGHGLLGSLDEIGSDMVVDMAANHDIVYCATNWLGMAEEDIVNAGGSLLDLSNFHTVPERQLEGFLAFLFLGRVMKHEKGFVTNAAFQLDGKPLLKRDELFYDGNSQGAILGGALMAVATDFTRGVLGEAGMNYSMLLGRSVDFDDFLPVLERGYPAAFDQMFGIHLTQLLWDRGEVNGYAQHLTDDPLPRTPKHTILLLGALGDHQVSEFSLQIQARTIGARGHVPYTRPDRTRGTEHGWEIIPIPAYPFDGSAYFLFDTGSPVSPLSPEPPREGHDPHDDTPNIAAAQKLKDAFMRPDGKVIDVCDAAPCTGPPRR